jgi:hypothetical protein
LANLSPYWQTQTEIGKPRPRLTNPSPFPTINHHAEIEIGANPSPFPTVNHHATTKSTENRGEIWRTENRGESIEKEKKGRERKKLCKMKERKKKKNLK